MEWPLGRLLLLWLPRLWWWTYEPARHTRTGRMRPLWWLTKDGDLDCLELYERHYSAYQYADGRERKLFTGPGEKVVLRTEAGDAMFVWRRFIDGSGECGINCAVFRNEGVYRSSELIRQADAIADAVWTCLGS